MPTVAVNNWQANNPLGPTALPSKVFAITPSDADELAEVVRVIRCAVDGNVSVVYMNGGSAVEPITTTAPLKGFIKQVKSTSTTATGLRGYP